ncbi:hypothetical protein ACFL2Q_18300 [Thermodesulfobacteriota bacterium]
MGGKSVETIAKETSEIRLKMHELVQSGVKEKQALLEVLPKDSNRARRLALWRSKGLWPVRSQELEQDQATAPEKPSTEQLKNKGVSHMHTDDIQPEPPAITEQTTAVVQPTAFVIQSGNEEGTIQDMTTVVHLDTESQKALSDMLKWWRARESGEVTTSEIRPEFRRKDTIPKSVRLDRKMAKAAEQKAKQDKIRTGGTFNSLVEVLIWEYLGKDKDFLDQ